MIGDAFATDADIGQIPPPLDELPPPAFTVSFELLGLEGLKICTMTTLEGVINTFAWSAVRNSIFTQIVSIIKC